MPLFEYSHRARQLEDTSPERRTALTEERDRELEDHLGREDARITELEGHGWHPIGSGNKDSLTVTVPPGVSIVRVHWAGYASTAAWMCARVNNDSTSGRHLRNYTRLAVAGTTVASGTSTGAVHLIGRFLSSLQRSWGQMDIYPMDPILPVTAKAAAQDGTPAAERFEYWGAFNVATETLSSIVLLVDTGSLTALEWRAEGYVP